MKNLKYYIGGMLSVLFILPILNKLLEAMLLWIETLKIKPSMKIMNFQKDTTILQDFIKQPMAVDDYDEEYMYYEDDDED